MPSIERELSGDALRFDLADERTHTVESAQMAEHGRSARTLVKEGPLRVTLVALRAGSEIADHAADGPITVQTLAGSIRFTAAGREHHLQAGDLLTLRAGIRHSVRSDEGGSFLLTVLQLQ